MEMTRKNIKPYLEFIPDPTVERWCPCTEPTRFPNSDVQQYLSCLARNNSLYLVANFGDIQPCNKTTDPNCPSDSHYQFNTDIVYDKSGTLIARYHKENLFFEDQFNKPPKTEFIAFYTPFGRFGVFTCFDIMFHDPAVALVANYNVTGIVFPTAWMDALPLLAAVQFHSAFAAGAGVNLLAANIHKPTDRFHGSGIYTPNGALSFYYNDTTDDGKLLINDVKVIGKTSHQVLPADLSNQAHVNFNRNFLHIDQEPVEFNSSVFHDIFTFKALKSGDGNLTVCQGSLCCQMDYKGKIGPDLMAFGAFDGLHTYQGGYYLQICALLTCASDKPETCGASSTNSSATFSRIGIKGNFSTNFVYPEILLTNLGQLALPSPDSWKYEGNSLQILNVELPVLSVSLFGRLYKKDP